MPERFHLQQPELAQAVATALARCRDVKDQQRLLTMRLAASGQFTATEIAQQLQISRRQFFNWVAALKAGGVEGLLQRRHGGGARPQVQGKVWEQFQEGLKSGRWKRAKDIQQWLLQRHEVKMSIHGIYYWLGKLGGVLKLPRKAHAKKDARQTAEF